MTPAEILVTLEAEPADHVRAAILKGLKGYNRQFVGPPDYQPLVIVAREGDAVVGGAVGETGWGWLHVDLLWVADGYRGRGLGRRLLEAAEEEARGRGAERVYLDTFDFQARPFYERLGYAVFGVQEDFPPGHTRFFLRKELEKPRGADE